jgi:hypothetical protein
LHARDLRLRFGGMTKDIELHCPLEPDLVQVLENLRHANA